MHTVVDPADQLDLQKAFESAQQFLDSTASILSQAQYVVRLAYIAAMSGLAATVEASAPYLAQKEERLEASPRQFGHGAPRRAVSGHRSAWRDRGAAASLHEERRQ